MNRRDKLLMGYLDGTLSEAQRREVEELVARSPAARDELAAYADIGQELRRSTAEMVAARSFDGFAERVERAARAAPPASFLERLRVRVHDWMRPAALWPAAAAATVAVAALVAAGLGAGRAQANTCTIESVDYGGNAAAIFLIPDEHGKGSTTVIWANPDEEKDAGEPQ
jgi:anti-sigma factor RsiW